MKICFNKVKILSILFLLTVFFPIHNADAAATKLYDLDATSGTYPYGSLTVLNDVLYGIGSSDGINTSGTIFKYNPAGAGTFTKLHDLDSGSGGYFPYDSLTLSGSVFYGTTSYGGTSGTGTIFSYNPAGLGTYTTLYSLSGSDGDQPEGSLVLVGGVFYGMTNLGGANSFGTIFSYDPAGAGTFTKLYDFDGTDGRRPYGSLVSYNSKLYGATLLGGVGNAGVLFSYDPAGAGTFAKLYDFDTTNGANPRDALTVYNSKLYGLTQAGGLNSIGVIFSYDPAGAGTFTKLYDFDGTNGSTPYGSLTVSDDVLYGMTNGGGDNSMGVVFSYDPAGAGTFAKLHDFDGANTGSRPYGSVTFLNGLMYGLTNDGGVNDAGAIFSLSLTANPTVSTDPASSVSSTTVILNGTVSDTGGANVTTRGFEYGLTTGYGSTMTDTGSYTAGSFTGSITGLTCATTYNFRSYATNTVGTSYGSNTTFTMSACPSTSSVSGYYPRYNQSPIFSAPVIVTLVPVSQPYVFKLLLKQGVKNNEVLELQKFLNKYGADLIPDGNFGKKTKSALIKFQESHNLEADGISGPKTRGVMNAMPKML